MSVDLWKLLVLLLVVTTEESCCTRNVSSPEINPDCPQSMCAEPWLIHVVGVGTNDSLHHLWGVRGALSFLVVETDRDTKMSVNWTNFETPSAAAASVSFDTDPRYIFGIAIPNLILFNDTNDSGKMDNDDKSRIYVPMSDFGWEIKLVSNSSDNEGAVKMETTTFKGQELANETKISIQIAAYGQDGRSTVLPHLLRTPNSAQLDLVLDHMVLDLNTTDEEQLSKKDEASEISGFKNARWAMDLIIFSSESKTEKEDGISHSKQKSLDDENTPGVFHLDEITTSLARMMHTGGYLQWRPVSYLSSKRDINLSTNPNLNGTFIPLDNISEPLEMSLAYAVMGNQLTTHMNAKTLIAFGQSKDDFYTANNYTTWTVAMGYGYPPKEKFSTMVIIVISIGVGIPVVMFLIGGILLASHKCRQQE